MRSGEMLGPRREKEVKCQVCKKRMEMREWGFRLSSGRRAGLGPKNGGGEGTCQWCRELRVGILGLFWDRR